MSKLRIGFVLTGSFCTFAKVMPVIQALIERGDTVTPILSDSAGTLDTRFGTAAHWREELTSLTGISPIDSIVSAEPIGPKALFDILIVAPCTGNTLARLAHGLTDTPATIGQKPSARRASGRAGGLHQRRSVRQRRQSRHAAESPVLLFRAAPAGCAAQQAALACRRYDADSRFH